MPFIGRRLSSRRPDECAAKGRRGGVQRRALGGSYRNANPRRWCEPSSEAGVGSRPQALGRRDESAAPRHGGPSDARPGGKAEIRHKRRGLGLLQRHRRVGGGRCCLGPLFLRAHRRHFIQTGLRTCSPHARFGQHRHGGTGSQRLD